MSVNTDLIYDAKRKMLAKYPRFGSEIAVANIEFKDNLKYHTVATDAIINANLERDGFTIKEVYVNMLEALDYSAEEFYQKLLQEKISQKQEDGQEHTDIDFDERGEFEDNRKEKRYTKYR